MEKPNLNSITTKLTSLLEPDKESFLPTKPGVLFIILLGLTAAFLQFGGSKESVSEPIPQEPIDTFIPENESLFPVTVSNYESLDQIIGQFGVVDLYTAPKNPMEKPRKVATAVKLIRSPKSPNHFSVLVPADKAIKIAGFHGEFTVVVRNPKIVGTDFVKDKTQAPKRRVVYESETQ